MIYKKINKLNKLSNLKKKSLKDWGLLIENGI